MKYLKVIIAFFVAAVVVVVYVQKPSPTPVAIEHNSPPELGAIPAPVKPATAESGVAVAPVPPPHADGSMEASEREAARRDFEHQKSLVGKGGAIALKPVTIKLGSQ